ncbi:hypothetical protein A8950_3350 [Dongia mobilis]|uniref:Uncharacterized protein n=1 Tax=Dongia mobilis TaxID=578943 RepID=A0A4R6WJS4_9PROT|nr:hypothetical protein [Dongia mobilis]TDQ78888.1 hypothetical protein A8950_3350 [Dongia mobilis]
MPESRGLPEIAVIDLGAAGFDRLALMAPEKVARLAAAGRALVTGPVQAAMDWRSRGWLARNVTPYAVEIAAIAGMPGISGVYALNLSTEWACSSMVNGGRLMRVLDWPLNGLGDELTVTRHQSPHGAWWQATWPGFVGVLTGLAPGRFAAAYNQPPIRRTSGVKPVDWVLERIRVHRRRAIPPTHLLRQVFEKAADFDEALALLAGTPLSIPALFSLTGVDGRSMVVERLEERVRLRPGPVAISNHWPEPGQAGDWPRGYPRGVDSPGRFRDACALAAELDGLPGDFAWLRYPILNKYSRLAVMADCVAGSLAVLGLEQAGESALPATRTLRLNGLKAGT